MQDGLGLNFSHISWRSLNKDFPSGLDPQWYYEFIHEHVFIGLKHYNGYHWEVLQIIL